MPAFFVFVHLHNNRFVEKTILFASISTSWGRLSSFDWRMAV
jgi:hypothetical protein